MFDPLRFKEFSRIILSLHCNGFPYKSFKPGGVWIMKIKPGTHQAMVVKLDFSSLFMLYKRLVNTYS